jgi:hypothetical protein
MMFLLWVSWIFWRTDLPRFMKFVLAFIIVGVVGSGLFQHYAYKGFPYGPYRKLSIYFSGRLSERERIVHSNKLTMLPTYYHDPSLPQVYVADPEGSGTDTLSEETQAALGIVEKPSIEAAVDGASIVYFIIFSREISEVQRQGLKTHPYIFWIEENYHLRDVGIWQDIRVYSYREK